jgi:protein deglycase
MKRIAVFLANGFEEIEAITPIDIWRRAGFEVTTISIEIETIVTGSHQIKIVADKTKESLGNQTFDLYFLPGGMPGARNLAASKFVSEQLKKAHQQNKHLAAICAAPLVLGQLGLLQGKKATCFPGFESELTGAQHTGTFIQTDGNITTGKGAGAALAFALEVVATIGSVQLATELKAKLQTP